MTTEIDQKFQETNQNIQDNNGAAVSSDGRLHSSPSDSQKIGTSDVGKSSRGGSTKGRASIERQRTETEAMIFKTSQSRYLRIKNS